MSEHVVTFEARAHTSAVDGKTAAVLLARCTCGWVSTFVPNKERAHLIVSYGLQHVSDALAKEKGERYAPPVLNRPESYQ